MHILVCCYRLYLFNLFCHWLNIICSYVCINFKDKSNKTLNLPITMMLFIQQQNGSRGKYLYCFASKLYIILQIAFIGVSVVLLIMIRGAKIAFLISVKSLPYTKFGSTALSFFTICAIWRKNDSLPMYPVNKWE